MNRTIILSGILLIVIAIIFGAFGAHLLKELITAEKLLSFEVGVRYQMYHGLALLIIGMNADKFTFSLQPVIQLIWYGVILFCGSIYLLALQDVFKVSLSYLGPITPVGGTLLIVAWVILFIKFIRSKA